MMSLALKIKLHYLLHFTSWRRLVTTRRTFISSPLTEFKLKKERAQRSRCQQLIFHKKVALVTGAGQGEWLTFLGSCLLFKCVTKFQTIENPLRDIGQSYMFEFKQSTNSNLKKCKQTFSLTFVHWIKTSCIKIRLYSKSHVLSVVCVGLVSFSPLHSSLSQHVGPWSQQRSPSQCNEPVTQSGNMWQGTDLQWFILSTQFCFWFYVFMVHWPLICERKALSLWSVRLTWLERSSLAHIIFQPQTFPTLIYSTKTKWQWWLGLEEVIPLNLLIDVV